MEVAGGWVSLFSFFLMLDLVESIPFRASRYNGVMFGSHGTTSWRGETFDTLLQKHCGGW